MSESISDHLLVEESRGGSPVAFDQIMRRYERLVYTVAWTYTHERESALDVTQEVFLKAYRKLGGYRGAGSFRAWLIRITCRETLNWLRKHRRMLEAEELPPDIPALPGGGDQEADFLLAEDIARMRAGIAGLPARQRLAVSLRYFEGMSVREMAAALGCTEGTGKNLLFRALQKLRGQFPGDPEARNA
jgi:RNA polymerase sigma-70 factor (ECF subfamily)